MELARYLRALTPQLAILALLCILHLLAFFEIIPSVAELTRRFASLLETSSLSTVALFSFLENLPGVSIYFPGSIVILARMTMTAGMPGEALATYIHIVVPAIVANILSFFGGRVFSGSMLTAKILEKGPGTVPRSLWTWYFSTYWHPQFAAVTAFASGSGGVAFRSYLRCFLAASISWSCAWALLLYNLGFKLELKTQFVSLTYIYLLAWSLWSLWAVGNVKKLN